MSIPYHKGDRMQILEGYSRLQCPRCGNKNHKHMEELDDRTKPLYNFSNGGKPMYAKKTVCTECKCEF